MLVVYAAVAVLGYRDAQNVLVLSRQNIWFEFLTFWFWLDFLIYFFQMKTDEKLSNFSFAPQFSLKDTWKYSFNLVFINYLIRIRILCCFLLQLLIDIEIKHLLGSLSDFFIDEKMCQMATYSDIFIASTFLITSNSKYYTTLLNTTTPN